MSSTLFSQSKSNNQGFTLLELLIAIMLFSLISTASYQLFMSVSVGKEATEATLQQLDEIQRAEMLIEHDLMQIAPRSVKASNGQPEPALKVSSNSISFTKQGKLYWQQPLYSELERVEYHLENQTLIRTFSPLLDRTPNSDTFKQTLLTNVNKLQFKVLDNKNQWNQQWPSVTVTTDKSATSTTLPAAVEITIHHQIVGSIVTIVPLSRYSPDKEKLKNQEDKQQTSSTESNNANSISDEQRITEGW